MKSHLLSAVSAGCAFLLLCGNGVAQGVAVSDEVDQSIERGLAYLAETQFENGAFPQKHGDGGAISGYSATGSCLTLRIPASTITMLMTMAKRGLSMKIRENILLHSVFSGACVIFGDDLRAGQFRLQGQAIHKPLPGAEHIDEGFP